MGAAKNHMSIVGKIDIDKSSLCAVGPQDFDQSLVARLFPWRFCSR
jgi:hypothetical protein